MPVATAVIVKASTLMAQTVPSGGTLLPLKLENEYFDPNKMHNPKQQSERLVAPVTGIYMAIGQVEWAGGTVMVRAFHETAVHALGPRIDYRFAHARAAEVQDPNAANIQNVVGLVQLNADDWVQLEVAHTVGQAQNVAAASFSLHLVTECDPY